MTTRYTLDKEEYPPDDIPLELVEEKAASSSSPAPPTIISKEQDQPDALALQPRHRHSRASTDGGNGGARHPDRDNLDVEEEEAGEVEDGPAAGRGHLVIPWRYKAVALLLACVLPLGQNWTTAALGPLKAELRKQLHITNTQYGVIGSAGAIVNSVWPLIGGICLDWFGINTITLLCTGGIFIGSIVAALAANTGLWRMMVGGHIMMGFGTSVLDSAQHKIFYHYFGAGGLALAFGIEYATANLFLMCSGFSTIPIKDGTGWYGWSFWIPTCLCLFSFLVNIYYVLWESRILPTHMRMPNGRAIAIAKRASGPVGVVDQTSIHPRVVLAIPWAFWVLPMTQLFQSQAAYGPLSESATDLIMMKGYSEKVAAYTANVRNILPIVLTPFIGLAIDRWGHRFHLMAFAPVLWVIACAIIGFTDVHPLLPVIISSLGATITAFPIQVTIPLLLRDQQKIGTAFGVWRCFNNSGGTLMSIIQGIVQDRTPNMAYTNVLLIGIAFKTLDVFIGLGYIAMDYLYLGRGITMGEKQRLALEDQIDDPTSDRLTRRTAYHWVSVAGLCLLGGMVGSAWAVFIKYVL